MKLLYCGSAPFDIADFKATGKKNPDGTLEVRWIPAQPREVTVNGEKLSWYTCNDGNNASFPPLILIKERKQASNKHALGILIN